MPDRDPAAVLTIGDPAGIGPEIAAALLMRGQLDSPRVYLAGSAEALLANVDPGMKDRWKIVPEGGTPPTEPGGPVIMDVERKGELPSGRPSPEGGRISGRAIEIAVDLVKKGFAAGIVTGPVSKEALALGGYPFKGHTSMLSHLFGAPDCQMVMVSGRLRIVILTRDIPLAEVPAAVTGERIKTGVRVTVEALKEYWNMVSPRILVAALNPHAGDGGINGTEESDIIIPALEELKKEGIDVDGPVPSDTLFYNWQEKRCDAFVALYHDQGMIPFKIGGFDEGVNMTIGLPVVRTSVCHGTAFDIAGRNMASPASLEAALGLARRCAARKKEKTGV